MKTEKTKDTPAKSDLWEKLKPMTIAEIEEAYRNAAVAEICGIGDRSIETILRLVKTIGEINRKLKEREAKP